jgi:hypothetical protein
MGKYNEIPDYVISSDIRLLHFYQVSTSSCVFFHISLPSVYCLFFNVVGYQVHLHVKQQIKVYFCIF